MQVTNVPPPNPLSADVLTGDLNTIKDNPNIQQIPGQSLAINKYPSSDSNKASSDGTTTGSDAATNVKIASPENIQALLKALDKVTDMKNYKLTPEAKQLLTDFMKAHTANTTVKDGLSTVLQSQRDLARVFLELSQDVLADLFSETDLVDPKNNLTEKAFEKLTNNLQTLIKEAAINEAGKTPLQPPTQNPAQTTTSQTTQQPLQPATPQPNTPMPQPSLPSQQPAMTDTPASPSAQLPPTTTPTGTPNQLPSTTANPNTNTTGTTPQNTQQPTINQSLPQAGTTATTTTTHTQANQSSPTAATQPVPTPTPQPLNQLVQTQTQSTTPEQSQPQTTTPPQAAANQAHNTNPTPEQTKSAPPTPQPTIPPAESRAPQVQTAVLKAPPPMPELPTKPQTNAELLLGKLQQLNNLLQSKINFKNADLFNKFMEQPLNLNKQEQAQINDLLRTAMPKTFTNNSDFNKLENLLRQTINAHKLPDSEAGDLAALSKILQNSSKVSAMTRQVSELAENIKDMSNTIMKNLTQNAEFNTKNLQGSFMLLMNMAEGEKAKPAFIHLYHEREGSGNPGSDGQKQTWLRVNLDYEHSGLVTAIFHLWQGNILDIKVSFPEHDAAVCFNAFMPELMKNLRSTNDNLQINNIVLTR